MSGKTGVILLIEDNENVLYANRLILEEPGHKVLCAQNLAEARELLKTEQPDVAVVDIMLPDGNGLEFMPELRAMRNIPVLFLTGKTENEDMLAGLQAGGNDYITKPYRTDEFKARVEAALRWEHAKREERMEKVEVGPIKLDLLSTRATLEETDLELTGREFDLLLLLIQNEDKVLRAEYIYERVWAQSMNDDKNTLQATISRLRKKIESAGFKIVSVRGTGYQFVRLG